MFKEPFCWRLGNSILYDWDIWGNRSCLIVVESHDRPVYCHNLAAKPNGIVSIMISKQHSRMAVILSQLIQQIKKTLGKLAHRFFLDGEVLYKRAHDGVLLRCVDGHEKNKIMSEIRDSNANPKWANSSWPWKSWDRIIISTMEIDFFKHFWKCHLFQIYADKNNQPLAPLHNITSPWPFSMWRIQGIDMVNPTTSDRHRFILVAIDYFTK